MIKIKSDQISKESNKNNVFLVMTGFSCNNNCIFCSNLADRDSNKTTEEVMSELEHGHEQGYKILEFIGGETTIRADFLDLITYAKKIGYKDIRISSNGRLFSYPKFTQDAEKAGLAYVGISFYGHNQALHQAATRTPGSFEQCLAGIKNILKTKKISLAINTVITKLNYRALPEMAAFLNKLGVKEWRLIELIPDGAGKENYRILATDYHEVVPYISQATKIAKKISAFFIYDFPFCVFKKNFISKPSVYFFTPMDRCEKVDQQGYAGAEAIRALKVKKGNQVIYQDKYRTKPTFCKQCSHYYYCGGITNEYIKLFGLERMKKTAKKYQNT
jgi:MoaA/NifB/PqqE/SkfB family radical SAM enzyme